MKLLKLLIPIICLLSILTACNGNRQDIVAPVNFYYLAENITYDNPTGVLMADVQESCGHEADYVYLTNQYFAGPESTECVSPFPEGLQLESLNVLTGKVSVVMSTHFAELTGHKLTLACSCLAKTLLEMTGVDAVTISIKGTAINGEPSVTFTKNDFILTDSNEYIPSNSQ